MKVHVTCLTTVLLVGSVAAPVFARLEDRADLMKRAQDLSTAGNYAESEKLLDRAIPLDPKDNLGWLLRGYVRIMQKNYDGAIADGSSGLVALALSNPSAVHSRAIAFTNRASAWNGKGEPHRALVDAIAACSAEEKFSKAWLVRADIQYALGNLDQANICLQKALAIEPSLLRTFSADGAAANARKYKPLDYKADINPAFKAAYTLQNEKKTDEAIAAYAAILATNPLIANAWGNRGNIYADMQRNAEAIADYTVAITASGLAENAKDDQARILTNRADVYSSLGRHAEAVNDLELAVKIKPDYAVAVELLKTARETLASQPSASLPPLERARILVEKARANKEMSNPSRNDAIVLLDRLNLDEPNNAQAWYLRGVAEEIRFFTPIGLDEKALAFYEKALALDDRIADAHYRRGKLLSGGELNDLIDTPAQKAKIKAREARASADFDRALQLGLRDAGLFAARAGARLTGGNAEGALADLNEALKLEPKEVKYLQSRASALERLKRWKEAIADRTALLGDKPNSFALVSRAEDYVQLKDWASAFADYDRAVSLRPDDADFYIDRAKGYRLKGDRAKAFADYAKARALDSDFPAVAADLSGYQAAEALRHDLGHIMKGVNRAGEGLTKSMGEVTKAQRRKAKLEGRLQRMLGGDKRSDAQILANFETDEKAGDLDEEDYYDRAGVKVREKDLPQAIADLTKAIGLKTDYHEAYNRRGVCYETQKEYEKAFADYDRAVSLQPKFEEYLRNRGDMHYERNRFDDAWKDYDAAVRNAPKNAVNYFKRGNANFKRGKLDEAIADYDKTLELDPSVKAAASNRDVARRKKGN